MYVKGFDMIGLTETWMEKKGWEKLVKGLSEKFTWTYVPAWREHRKGRAKRRLVVATNKGLKILKQESYGERILEC